MVVINLNQQERMKCLTFAEKCVDSNIDAYHKRGQKNREKIINDIYQGKTCELALSLYLTKIGFPQHEPDFEIYEKSKKSFSADLSVGDFKIHVKSQNAEQAEKYGMSWVFEKKDKLITKPKEEDFIALVLVKSDAIELKKIIKAQSLVDCYKPPKIKWLDTKACLYYEDIKFKRNAEWLKSTKS